MSEATVRLAVNEDVPAIRRLIEGAYGKYVERIGRLPAPMTADYGRLIEIGDTWVLVVDGDVAGVIVLESRPDHLRIGNVAVAAALQGKGLGSKLLAFAEGEARRRHVSEMRLYTHQLMHENIEIYRRLGWTEYDRAEQNGFPRVFMRKPVDRESAVR